MRLREGHPDLYLRQRADGGKVWKPRFGSVRAWRWALLLRLNGKVLSGGPESRSAPMTRNSGGGGNAAGRLKRTRRAEAATQGLAAIPRFTEAEGPSHQVLRAGSAAGDWLKIPL